MNANLRIALYNHVWHRETICVDVADLQAARTEHDELIAALRAIVAITDGSQPIDHPGALMVARSALAKVQS